MGTPRLDDSDAPFCRDYFVSETGLSESGAGVSMLQFSGNVGVLKGSLIAVAAALLAFLLYRNALKHSTHQLSKYLPWLRSGAVLLLVLMLTGPTLRYRSINQKQTRLSLIVDLSQSMGVTDQEMDTARKMGIIRALGWLPYSTQAAQLEKATEALGDAIRTARLLPADKQLTEESLYKGLSAFQKEINTQFSRLPLNTLTASEAEEIEKQFNAPLKRLIARFKRAAANPVSAPKECLEFIEIAARWQLSFQTLVERTGLD